MFSLLYFKYSIYRTDSKGSTFIRADQQVPNHIRTDPVFEAVVKSFWDNPGDDDCNATVVVALVYREIFVGFVGHSSCLCVRV